MEIRESELRGMSRKERQRVYDDLVRSATTHRLPLDNYIAMGAEEQEAVLWGMAGQEDDALNQRLQDAGVAPATASLDRPRTIVRPHAGWWVFVLEMLADKDRRRAILMHAAMALALVCGFALIVLW